MILRFASEVQMTWEEVLKAVARHAVESPVESLAEYDAERLITAANNILCRIQEFIDGRKEPTHDPR